MSNRTPYAQPWIWDRGKTIEIPGVMIRAGARSVFIPGNTLRRIADTLHDIADDLEEVTGDDHPRSS